MDNIISKKEFRERTGFSRTSEWRYETKGLLPKTVTVGGRVLGYLESSYNKWIEDNTTPEDDDTTED